MKHQVLKTKKKYQEINLSFCDSSGPIMTKKCFSTLRFLLQETIGN